MRKQTKLLHQRNDCVLNFIAALTLSVVERKKKKKEERRRKTERKKPDTRKPENILDILKNRTRLTQAHQSH